MTDREVVAWMFQFGLENQEGELLAESVATELMEHLIEWAEERNLQIGGGFFPDTPEQHEKRRRVEEALTRLAREPGS
jgi:hypothetical protein